MNHVMLKRPIVGPACLSCFAAVFFFTALSAFGQGGLDFAVAPDGNDAWAGTADRPFATLERARNAIRDRHDEFVRCRRGVVVEVGEGVYALDRPFVLTPEDSGTEGMPILYRAAQDARPILSGGRVLSGWTETAPGHWETTVTVLEPVPEMPRGDDVPLHR